MSTNYLIKATINHLRICKARDILIVPEWPSSLASFTAERNSCKYIMYFNPHYTIDAENSIFKGFVKFFKTIALLIDFSRN